MKLLWILFWISVCFAYANNAKDKYPNINIEPKLYLIGGLVFGPFSLLLCIYKVKCYEKYRK